MRFLANLHGKVLPESDGIQVIDHLWNQKQRNLVEKRTERGNGKRGLPSGLNTCSSPEHSEGTGTEPR